MRRLAPTVPTTAFGGREKVCTLFLPAAKPPSLRPKDDLFHALQFRRRHRHGEHGAGDSHQQQRGKGFAGDDLLVQQHVGEDDHDERLGLQQPADDGSFARLPFEYLAGDVCADQFSRDRGEQQNARGDEHGRAAHGPVGAQACAEEEHRHEDQQHMVTQCIHLLLVEPAAIHDGAGEERADHEVQPRPVGAEAADGQPDQADVPAVMFLQPQHEFPEEVTGDAEGQ